MLAIEIIRLSYPADSNLPVRNLKKMLDNTRWSSISVRYMDRSEGKIEEGEKRKEGKEGREGGREGCCLPANCSRPLIPRRCCHFKK